MVYSKEEPRELNIVKEKGEKIIGSVAFVPLVVGLIMAGEVIKDLGK